MMTTNNEQVLVADAANLVEQNDGGDLSWLPSGALFSRLLGDVSGGVISGSVAITYGVSYAVMLFSGPLEQYLAYGISVALLTAFLGAAIVCLTSSLYFSVAGPDSNTTSVFSVMLSSLAAQLVQAGAGEEILSHAMLALFISTLAAAIILYTLGALRIGQWVRYIPHPVMGGFLAATGWLMTSGALGIVADTPLTMAGLNHLMERGPDLRLFTALGLAGVFFFTLRRFRHPLALVLVLAASMAAVYAGLWLSGTDMAAARAGGWLFEGLGDVHFFPPWQLAEVPAIRWDLLLSHVGEMVAVIMVAAITILLSATGLETATRQDMDLDRELRGHGLANLAMALSGGYLGLISLGRSLAIFRAGGTTRLSGLIVGGMCAFVLFVSPMVVGFLPKIVLGSFLLYLGFSLLHEWLIESRSRFLFWEHILVAIILIITVRFGFTVGILAGIVGSCLDFAYNYSRVEVIKHDMSGVEFRSNFERPEDEQIILDKHGHAVRIVVFQGFIFFGMANPLLDRIRHHLDTCPGLRFLILDFDGVHGVDTSAAMVFLKARQVAERFGARVILTGLSPRLQHVLRGAGAIDPAERDSVFVSLDEGLEWTEDRVIEAHCAQPSYQVPVLDRWLLSELGDGIAVELLKTFLHRVYLDAGEYLFRQGSPSDKLYLIDSGRVSILVNEDGDYARRIVSLLGGTMFGGEDLYTDGRRSTSALAELPSVVYGLPVDGLERLSTEYPRLAAQFHGIILRLMAKRLRLANNEISMLRQEVVARKSVGRK